MAEFQYLAKDDKGLIQKGSIEAESRDIAVQTLIKRGLTPQTVQTIKKAKNPKNIATTLNSYLV